MTPILPNLFVLMLLASSTYAANPTPLKFVNATKASFAHPHDLVLSPDSKHLFVTDMRNHVVKILHPTTLDTLAIIGENELRAPHDVAFDPSGRLLVADSGNNRVVIYRIDGFSAKIITVLNDNMSSPEGVTSDPQGNIYVANAANNLIQVFQDNKLIKQSGSRGSAPGEYIRAHDIEYHNGKLYIADPGNNRIQVLDTDLQVLNIITGNKQSFNEPKYLNIDDNNRLYVADQNNNTLRIFDLNNHNQELHQITHAGNKSLNSIEGVEVFGNDVWVSDTANNRIVQFQWQQ